MKNFVVFIACCFVTFVFAQEERGNLKLGQWKSHLPYTAGYSVTQNAEKVFFATDQSVFSVDKLEHSIQLFNKISGLSDAGIRKIKYYTDTNNSEFDGLLIAYQNSNLDLVRKGKIINLNDIQRKSISGDKRINHIFYEGKDAWLSCGFGMVKLDMVAEEFLLTSFTNFPVNAMSEYNGILYASTVNGIYTAPKDGSVNLTDFGTWTKLGVNQGLPASYFSNVTAAFNGKLYAGIDNDLYVFDGTTWSLFYSNPNHDISNIFVGKDRLVCDVITPGRDIIVLLSPNGTPTEIFNEDLTGLNPQSIEDEAGNLWVSDYFLGHNYYEFGSIPKKFVVEGPYSIDVGAITTFDGEIWAASANLEPKWNPKGKYLGFSSLINDDWQAYLTAPEVIDKPDYNCIAVHPETRSIYTGTFSGGLVEFDRTNYTVHDCNNSTLQEPTAAPGSCRVSGLAFDEQNNLWASNYLSNDPINVFTADREWYSFSPNFNITDLTDVIVDDNGYKWFGSNSSGVLVYDSGADPKSAADDRYALLNSSNTALENNDIISLQKDLDGFIWVGTSAGVILFDCPAQVFENACPGRSPIAQEGGINDLLLGTESINAIAVDGANRKWFGTNNGIFVLQTDASEADFIFNTENSPLFDNVIIAIAIEEKTGEVFIGTEKGIISYRGNATGGATFFDKEEAYAFPNPVRPDYTGEIAIKGLVTDANVKITDVGGRLIHETTALGGQAIWNGMDYNGNRAKTGVYLVFATSRDGTKRLVTKVLFIN